MNQIIRNLVLILSFSTFVFASSEWINISEEDCLKNNGIMKDGVCTASWNDANAMCLSLEASLASMEQLKGLVKECGGVLNNHQGNSKNSKYQSCYKKKGFIDSSYYWSSNVYEAYEANAWVLYFEFGGDDWDSKTSNHNVRCVKSSE